MILPAESGLSVLNRPPPGDLTKLNIYAVNNSNYVLGSGDLKFKVRLRSTSSF